MKNLAIPTRIRLALSGTAALALALSALADTVKTKDGKTYEGTITAEDATSVTIKYMLTPKIPDTKTIPRTEIVSVEKKTPEDMEAEAAKKLLPTEDFLSRTDYVKLIEEGPAKFLASHPTSKYKAEIEKVKAELEAEMTRVRTGERKVDGKWITAFELQANEYNINGLKELRAMQKALAADDLRGALLAFVELENGSRLSVHYPKGIELALSTLEKYIGRLNQQVKDIPQQLAKQDEKLKNALPDDKKKILADREVAKKAFTAKIAEEKKAKVRFISTWELDKNNLTEAIRQAELEQKRITALDKAAITSAATDYEAVLKLIGQKKYDEAGMRLETLLKKDKLAAADKDVKLKGEEIKKLKEEALKEARQKELLDRTQPAPATPAPAAPAK